MEQNTINGVWLEGQIDETGISLTLISETSESGAQVEEIKHFSFEELQSASGDIFSLKLSDESQSALRHSQQSGQSAIADYVEELEKEIEETNEKGEGDVLIDDNPAPWSDDKRVVVEEVTDKQANEWHIDEFSTVADANPSYPEDDTVIVGHYEVTEKSYAFPESRLVEPDESTLSQKEWHDQYGN